MTITPLTEDAQERDLERALIDHIRDFLMELGLGFSLLGSQYQLVVSGQEYRLNLLFYHVHLHCYVVIDLKMGEFEPQHPGQMSFYVAAVDNLLRSDRDAPTIGIILCKTKDKTPPNFQNKLPTVEQLEIELSIAVEDIKVSSLNFMVGQDRQETQPCSCP